MRLAMYVSFAALCLATAGCTSGKKQTEITAGINLANLDTTALPGTDFYQYACGGWMKNHPLTGEYSRYGSFDMLAENNIVQLHNLIEEAAAAKHADGSIAQKIGDLYNLAMDSVRLNQEGATPLKELLAQFDGIKSEQDIPQVIALMAYQGANPYFSMYVGADDMNSNMNIAQIYQGGLGMGQRNYYLEQDEKTVAIREAYKMHIVTMFQLAGYDEAYAQKAMQAVMSIENSLAEAARSREDLRDPYANYNKKSLAEWEKEVPDFNWTAYLAAARLDKIGELNIGQPDFFKEVGRLLSTLPVADHIAYLRWNAIRAAANYLSDAFAEESFNFYGKAMTGRTELRPRWKRAVSAVEGALGEAVGQMYVEKYFPAAAKERMINLVKNLQTALGQRIDNLAWMGDSTKQKAKEKLATFHVKIGYPDKWKDYSTLAINNDSYLANMIRANERDYREMVDKVGKPVDKDEWLMTPQTVNAYYNPTTNEICFPAGILQYPFFDMNADDAFNYGAIGVVIGHEMTHGFDDQGRQYDKDGNLKDWWTADDAKNFDERAQVMVNFFDNIEVAPGVHANGKLTLGENIADYGGLQVSFQAFKNATKATPLADKDGFTPEQRFFLAYAGVWAANIRDAEVLRRTTMDEHSLGRWRVNGALPQIGAWYDAFHITDKDPMFISVDKRVAIW
ncbi:MAG: M13 family metallopeptidase [Mediterranea sp.]|nr:M13 family metallopeptidase [Mediterranea sp.]